MFLALAAMVMSAATLAKPVELKEYKQSTFDCAYFDWWYFGYSEAAYFGYVIFNEEGKEVAFTVMSLSETDMTAYYDGVEFKDEYEDRDVESHYYTSTYWMLNCPSGVRFGGSDQDQEIVAKHIKEVSSDDNSMFALRSGTYYLRVYEMFISDGQARLGDGYAQIKFTLDGVELQELKAEVSSDNTKATVSWTEPAPEDMPAGAHLYMYIESGAEVIYDNSSSKKSPENPLTIDVAEGRTYKVKAQYVTSSMKPLGSETMINFTVGTNQYTPTSLTATVTNDDQVELAWSATKRAEYYGVDVYQNGFIYARYNTTEQKLSKTLPSGTYTWEVAAFEKGDDGKGYAITAFVKGQEFTTKTAPMPEGSIEMNVWGMEAFYMKDYATAGNYPWLITLETGSTSGSGLPEPWIIVWSDREFGLSGKYSKTLNNVELSDVAGEGCLMNTNGTQAGLITATDVELNLQFDGFDQDYIGYGYYLPYYSGSFKMTLADGKIYYGTINQLFCAPYDYSEMTTAASSRTILYSMYDEGALPIDNVNSDDRGRKLIENGQLIIERNGVRYNALGNRIQ